MTHFRWRSGVVLCSVSSIMANRQAHQEAVSRRMANLPNEVVWYVCTAFFVEGLTAKEIPGVVRERFRESLHRTQVYDVIREGRRRGYFQLTPPRDEMLAMRMMEKFVVRHDRPADARQKVIKVVSSGRSPSVAAVAIAAAEEAMTVIVETFARLRGAQVSGGGPTTDGGPKVHVGFGAGATTMLVARYLAERFRAVERPPPMVLHALSSGFSVQEPSYAPTAFLSFFHQIPGFESRGLFGPAYVRPEEWEETKNRVGVREAFTQRDLLQVVITSLASQKDEDGELNRFMNENAELGPQSRQLLDRQEERIGDVMYRPFNWKGPITRDAQIRAVTLFELPELVNFAADPEKAVILVSGPCGTCGRPRDDALLPLLRVPSLDVWSHLVTDDLTATNCLAG